jgi:hypothetical protein
VDAPTSNPRKLHPSSFSAGPLFPFPWSFCSSGFRLPQSDLDGIVLLPPHLLRILDSIALLAHWHPLERGGMRLTDDSLKGGGKSPPTALIFTQAGPLPRPVFRR